MANILVTGGAGYIGSHTSQKLVDASFKVIVLDNLTTGFQKAVPEAAFFVKGDVRDSEKISKVIKDHKIDAVIHFAAKLNVAESLKVPLEYYENNTGGVLALVKACAETGVDKVVFSSTAAVYGDRVQSGSIVEGAPKGPLNPYGYSKLFSEQILQDMGRASGLRSVIFRYFNVAGAAEGGTNGQRTPDAYHLIHLAACAAVGKRPKLDIFGADYPTFDGTCVRDYIHVEDLADIHVLGLQYLLGGGASDVFNCGYGRGFSVREVIETFKKVSKVDFPVELKGRRAGDPASLIADSWKLRNIFGWIPKRDDLELICKSAFEWEKIKLLETSNSPNIAVPIPDLAKKND